MVFVFFVSSHLSVAICRFFRFNKRKHNIDMAKKKHRKERFLKLKMLVRRVKGFVVNPSVQFVAGLLCVAFVIFLTSSFLSFFSAGADDQSVVEAVASG